MVWKHQQSRSSVHADIEMGEAMLAKSTAFYVVTLVICVQWSQSAYAASFYCTTRHSYDLKAGQLIEDKFVWPRSWTFNEKTGVLDYGQRSVDKLKVTARDPNFNLTAYYFHNDTILSSIEFRLRPKGADFVWLKGGNSLMLSGTCDQVGTME